MRHAIETRALRKVYAAPSPRRGKPGPVPPPANPGEVLALDGIDLVIERGEFFGLLGPNGAGKTTTLGILTTRVLPTSGEAIVAGANVVTDAVGVRQRIGVVPQRPNPDRALTALENLVFHAKYFGFTMADATQRAQVLLDRFGIADKADAKPDALSGGQQQRLMIARALIHEPEIVFLDEPTVGLDPNARRELWSTLRELHAQGRTIVMTTHYMEEADALCERIAIVDRGRLLAVDTTAGLKSRAPHGTLIEVTLDGDAAVCVESASQLPGIERVEAHGFALHAYTKRGGELIPALIHAAEACGRCVTNLRLTSPSLESLFVSLTGRNLA